MRYLQKPIRLRVVLNFFFFLIRNRRIHVFGEFLSFERKTLPRNAVALNKRINVF